MNKKEAIEIIKKNWPDSRYTMLREALQTLIPELKDSENERMVKFIKNQLFNIKKTITENYELDAKLTKAIDWLEKQGEQKSQRKSALELWKDMRSEVYQQASGNRHEPNYSDNTTKMFSIDDIDEIFEKVAEKQCEQKDIEIPMTLDEAIAHCKEKSCGNSACAFQHQQLAQWLTELKEYKEQQPAEWSEEDEYLYNWCVSAITTHYNDGLFTTSEYKQTRLWLKTLKDRAQHYPKQECSEEDSERLQLSQYDKGYEDGYSAAKYNQWKPSEEQMIAVFDASERNDKLGFVLRNLYDDLRKL